MRSNLDELPDLLRIAIEMGADRFKGHHVWITHPGIEGESLRTDARSIHDWNECAEIMERIADDKRLPSGRKIMLANVYPLSEKDGQNSMDATVCPFLGREAWVSYNGRFDVCCAPDVKRRTLGEYGNVVESDIMDIWHGEAYNKLVKSCDHHEVCGQCNMKVRSHQGEAE
jgi:MoaA/NifB/PqqE/SkfB family radical SAM enzyme